MRRLDLSTRWIGSALLSAAVSLSPRPVSAQTAPTPGAEAVELTWEAPPNCPQRAAVQQRIRALAGPALRGAEPLRANGRIVFVNRRYRLTLSVREKGQLRERTIQSTACADLAGAAAVALGLLLRQRSVSEPPGPVPEATPSAPATNPSESASRPNPDVAPPAVAPPAQEAPVSQIVPPSSTSVSPPSAPDDLAPARVPDESSTAERSWKVLVRAPVVSLDLGPLPKPGFAVGGALGVRWDAWSVTAGGRLISTQTWLRPDSDVGAEVGRWQAEAAVCRGWRMGRTELSPCLFAGVDRIGARGTGPDVTSQSQHSFAFVLGAAGAFRLHLSDNIAIFAGASLGFETARPRLVISGLGEVGHVGPVQLSVGFGPEWTF